jgi:hypothetical protein
MKPKQHSKSNGRIQRASLNRALNLLRLLAAISLAGCGNGGGGGNWAVPVNAVATDFRSSNWFDTYGRMAEPTYNLPRPNIYVVRPYYP